MPYPTMSIERAQQLADLLRTVHLSGGNVLETHLDETEWVTLKQGDQYEVALVTGCASDLRASTVERLAKAGSLPVSDAYELESKMASEVHSCLSMLGMDLLEDEDFWRYLALFPFRWYLIAREPEIQPQDFGGYVEMIDDEGAIKRQKKSLITQLILRTYLWGKIVYDEDAGISEIDALVLALTNTLGHSHHQYRYLVR